MFAAQSCLPGTIKKVCSQLPSAEGLQPEEPCGKKERSTSDTPAIRLLP